MSAALREATEAYSSGEVPIGAVAVYHDQIIARAHNTVESLENPLEHAEIRVINAARRVLKQKWLHEVELYVTIEPCIFCAGAMVLTRIPRIVFGEYEPRTGAFGSKININDLGLNHRIVFSSGVYKKESAALMLRFFKERRHERRTA